MMQNIRIRAFNRFAKVKGVEKLVKCLKRNYINGITYHAPNGLKGDYDSLDTEDQIMKLIEYGKRNNPFIKCPIYETKQFVLRMVDKNDAEDLLKCYSDSISAKIFNSDNCINNFIYNSLEEMKDYIKFSIDQYRHQRFVRFSIVDKINQKAIGTIEFFSKQVTWGNLCKVGVLRIDFASKYEKEKFITEVLGAIVDNFYDDFKLDNIITKAIPEAKQRIGALKKYGFIELENNTIVPFDFYFIRFK